jgi:hypothetical protein
LKKSLSGEALTGFVQQDRSKSDEVQFPVFLQYASIPRMRDFLFHKWTNGFNCWFFLVPLLIDKISSPKSPIPETTIYEESSYPSPTKNERRNNIAA